MANAEKYLLFPDEERKKDPRIQSTKQVLQDYFCGRKSLHELRQAGFKANELAKESKTDISKYAARVFSQSIAVAHMRGHAIVSADYAIKVVNLRFPNDLDAVRKERTYQLHLDESYVKNGNKEGDSK